MSAQADIVINDSVPAAKTFSKRGATMDMAVWKDLTSGMDIGLPVITQQSRKTGRGVNATNIVDTRVYVPVLEAISGSDGGYTPSPKIAYIMKARTILEGPVRSTSTQRKDVFAFMANLLAIASGTNPVYQAFVNFDIPT